VIVSTLAVQTNFEEESSIFDNLGQVLPDIQKSGQRINLDQNLFPVSTFISNSGNYFSYLGSLTKPPCFNTITWIVLEEKINLPKSFVS